jgi:hypothetical protein
LRTAAAVSDYARASKAVAGCRECAVPKLRRLRPRRKPCKVLHDGEFVDAALFSIRRKERKICQAGNPTLNRVLDGLCRRGRTLVKKDIDAIEIVQRLARIANPHSS